MQNNSEHLSVSFEFFPPNGEQMEKTLWQSVKRLAPLNPKFMSVTYGAGSSTRHRTHAVVKNLLKANITVAPHLTCVDASTVSINTIASDYWAAGVRHIVALRGDTEQSTTGYRPHPNGYAYGLDLVRGLKTLADFEISVAAYPEVHPEAPSAEFDLGVLKDKVAAGASRAITQFFFDNQLYFRFRDKCQANGIDIPIVPGILPVTNLTQLQRFASTCGATVPDWLCQKFAGLEHDPDTRKIIAANIAIEQVIELQKYGVRDFHFYTLNRSELTYAICHAMQIRPNNPKHISKVKL